MNMYTVTKFEFSVTWICPYCATENKLEIKQDDDHSFVEVLDNSMYNILGVSGYCTGCEMLTELEIKI